MKGEAVHESFRKAIKERVPNHVQLTNLLVDILHLEKDAVYRRLRGDVLFSFGEIAQVAKRLNISLDCVLDNVQAAQSRPYWLKLVNHLEPTELDLFMMDDYLSNLKLLADDPTSRIVESTNILPIGFYGKYRSIARFYLFKWLYHYGDLIDSSKLYDEVDFPENVMSYVHEHYHAIGNIREAVYIFDPMVFEMLVNDLKYTAGINLLTPENIQTIKSDLLRLLDDIEQVAIRGYYREPQNRVRIYVSSVNTEAAYWYVESQNYRVSMVKVFVMNNMASVDEASFDRMKKRIEAFKRSSVMISESGEQQRRSFIDKQRQVILSL